jgi:hypothetical protein
MKALKPRLSWLFEYNFPDLWTWRQDDELVIDNQGSCFDRSCEQMPECRADPQSDPTKGYEAADVTRRGLLIKAAIEVPELIQWLTKEWWLRARQGWSEMPHCGTLVELAAATLSRYRVANRANSTALAMFKST